MSFRNRQRPSWTPEQIAEIYAGPHDRRVLGHGHDARITTAITIGRFLNPRPMRVADLSCGTDEVAVALGASHETILGDIAAGFQYHGSIEATIRHVQKVDIFVCLETLEHLDDPDMVLREIRPRADALVCSVPLSNAPEDDQNGEHYWAFDRAGAEEMLCAAGWQPKYFAEVPAAPGSVNMTYQCGIWGCA